MKLSNGTIRPGTVLQVLANGCIKASAPGLFSATDDPNKLPPIMPWFMGSNANAYSQPKVYDEVWIMNFSDNPQQLYWFRKDNISNSENIPTSETNVEIVCNRNVGGEWCSIYFSDGSGWIMGKGESVMQIRNDGTILLSIDQPGRCIDINGKNISIGKEGSSSHPAAYGDKTEEVLLALCNLLNSVAQKAMGNPHTAAIGVELMAKLPTISNKVPNISSQNVTIE